MRFRKAGGVLLLAALSAVAGCESLKTDKDRWLSPDKVIKVPEEYLQVVRAIRPNIGPADRDTDLVPNATFPLPSDLRYSDEDYILGAGDIVDISVLDLFSEGLETVLRRQVTESGFVDLPLLSKRVMAEGLTKEGLKDTIKDAYSPDILIDPTVSVTLIAQRQNAFSILGAVGRPSQYSIMRRDLRVLGALALAGGINQSNIRYIYVIRQSPPVVERAADGRQPAAPQDALPPLPKIPADADAAQPARSTQPVKPQAEDDNQDVIQELLELDDDDSDGGSSPSTSRPSTLPAPSVVPSYSEATSIAGVSPSVSSKSLGAVGDTTAYKWIWVVDKWVRVRQDAPTADTPSGRGASRVRPGGHKAPTGSTGPDMPSTDPLQWSKAGTSGLARIIAIDLVQLRNGDPKMNIVVRDKDVIHVPSLEIGEFYVMGEVLRPGVYSLTGRRITVKQAIAAAGNLAPLAWPENSILIRRVGDAEEQTIPLDIEKIFQGQSRDIFLKADDVIAVGTNWKAPFMAVVRNAFRLTYGFGFIYDRNFANPNPYYGNGGMTSKRFRRW